MLQALTALDEQIDGTLVRADNFHAVGMLHARFAGGVQAVYIDPPYNTDASAIAYKNGYKSSSWINLFESRVSHSLSLLSEQGVLCTAIDDEEVENARKVLNALLPKQLGVAAVRSNPQSRKSSTEFSPSHEYALFYGRTLAAMPGSLLPTEKRLSRYPKRDEKGPFAWMSFIRTGTNDKREDRPKLFYPLFVAKDGAIRVPKMNWSDLKNEYVVDERPRANEVAVFPVVDGPEGKIEKRWHRGWERVVSEPEEYRSRRDDSGQVGIDFKTRMDEEATPSTWWEQNEYASANYGAAELKELFGDKPFDFPKAIALVRDCLRASNANAGSYVLDFFAGSGTTAHAVIGLNREDAGKRKFIITDVATYFDTVIVPRVKKVVFASQWRDGKPMRLATLEEAERSPRIMKVFRLESYEDACDNIFLKPGKGQQPVFDKLPETEREKYRLHYMLNVESRGSASLLNIEKFNRPFEYTLRVTRDDVTREQTVDLVETFNWLLGLRVDTIRLSKDSTFKATDHGILEVTGKDPQGNRCLVIWRNTDEVPDEKLLKWFENNRYKVKDFEWDLIYVNGDNTLENLKCDDQTWTVRLIEQEFHRLMFEGTE